MATNYIHSEEVLQRMLEKDDLIHAENLRLKTELARANYVIELLTDKLMNKPREHKTTKQDFELPSPKHICSDCHKEFEHHFFKTICVECRVKKNKPKLELVVV